MICDFPIATQIDISLTRLFLFITVGTTALHLAAGQGHLKVYQAILVISEETNPVETLLGFPMTPSMWAVVGDQAESSKYILEKESDIQNDGYVKALHAAAVLNHLNVYSLLTQNEVDKNPECPWIRKTPLHWAAENGHLAMCRLIYTSVHEKNPQDVFQNTPLHCAAMYGHLEVSKFIIQKIQHYSLHFIY